VLKRFFMFNCAPALVVLALAAPVGHAAQAPPTASKPAATAKTVTKADKTATTAKPFVPKRLPWGDPDISGNFSSKDEANTPFERPDEFAGKRIEDVTPQELAVAIKERQRKALADAPYPGGGSRARGVAIAVPIHWFDSLDSVNHRPWFVTDPPDGKIPPITDAARKRAADAAEARRGRGTADSYTDRSLGDRCISRRGTPANLMMPGLYGNSFQILQTKDYVAIRYEMDPTRIIPIQGRGAARAHAGSLLRSYSGDSIAHWEGDTLVVDTINFLPNQLYRGSSAVNLHLIERFQRIAPELVNFTVTVEDPTTWTRPWSFSFPLTEDDGEVIFEYACHEGNYGLRNILSAGRSDDKKGIKSSNDVDAQADLESEQ
jgi:hypothetical protein